jgi:tetratricopeptide (TPR) repeat protein
MGDITGHNLGPYRLLGQIGAGGMATVYRAYHAAMDRYVAIKVLPQHLARDPSFRARFEREARTIARLEHRHILPVYDVAEDDGIPYLVMRLTDGGDMAGPIAAHMLPLDRAIELVAQVAEALEYAHRQGVIHRDVKPANVLISRDGDALLSDFGIAKIYEDTLQLTGDGAMIGTPAYMAPEQLQGKGVDARTDLYSLGVVLYQALTGECPFVAETPLAIAMMHIHNPLRPPRQINPAIPESVERIVLRALAKNPDDRFQSAGELAQALRAVLATGQRTALLAVPELPQPADRAPTPTPAPAVPATPAPIPASAPRPSNRLPLIAIGAVVAVLVIGAVAYALLRQPAASETASQGAPTVALAPDIGQALETALVHIDKNDSSAALSTLEPALAAHPDDASLLAMRGIANYMSNGVEEPARADVERALELNTNNALAYYARGYLNGRTDKPDEAIADYTRSIELNPNFARAYYARGILLGYPKNDAAGRQRDIDRAIEADPNYAPARMDRAWSLYYEDEIDRALQDVDHVISLDPQYDSVHFLRALLYDRLNRPAEARAEFETAVAAAPEEQGVISERGAFLVRQGDYAAALADWDRLVALDGAEPRWHALRGFTLHALGRDDQALEAFEQTLLIAGNEAWAARYGRGLALVGLGRAQDAIEDLVAAQAHPEDDPLASVSRLFYGIRAMPSIDLARAYTALGQPEQALQSLDTAIEQEGSFLAYLERGKARAAAGENAGAREDLQEALRRALEAKNDEQRAQVEAELGKLQ